MIDPCRTNLKGVGKGKRGERRKKEDFDNIIESGVIMLMKQSLFLEKNKLCAQ
jgi:hypothetical protein